MKEMNGMGTAALKFRFWVFRFELNLKPKTQNPLFLYTLHKSLPSLRFLAGMKGMEKA
jgi:hypothetical protein